MSEGCGRKIGPFDCCTVVVGDCLDVMAEMPNRCVDLTIADPPYNNGTLYGDYQDSRSDYLAWCTKWYHQIRRISQRLIITPGHGNLWMWGEIEKPWGIGCWFKPGNPQSSVLGWVTWEPWLYYTVDYRALGGPDTLRAPVSKQKQVDGHPCPKPLVLGKGFVQKVSKIGQVVFAPFLGSGTFCVAAKELGRHFFGCDINPEYVEIARKRLSTVQLGMPI